MNAKLSLSPSFTDKFIDYSSWIINHLLDVLVYQVSLYIFNLFIFWLALHVQTRQNTAKPRRNVQRYYTPKHLRYMYYIVTSQGVMVWILLESKSCRNSGATMGLHHVTTSFAWWPLPLPPNLLELFSLKHLLEFYITRLSNWLTNVMPLHHPIRSKTSTNHDLFTQIFPNFSLVTGIWLEFRLLHCIVCFLGHHSVTQPTSRNSVSAFCLGVSECST